MSYSAVDSLHGEDSVLDRVRQERERQDAKWGEQNHDPFLWLTILTEEVGEAAQAALKARFSGQSIDAYRDELIQVAAVAVAAMESLERGKWRWPNTERLAGEEA